MHIPLLQDIVLILCLSIAALLVCSSLRIPVLLGFLLTGIVAGPHGLGLVHAVHEVEMLAEIGVVLLLFTIGLEFSLREFVQIWRFVVWGGLLQVGLTIAAIFLLLYSLDFAWNLAIFAGLLIALSSTVIVLRGLQESGEIDSPHGKASLGILIFQDLAIVPFMLMVPILAGQSQNVPLTLALLILKATAVLLVLFLGSRYVLPWLFFQIAKSRSRELFLLSVLGLCLLVAWATASIGLSLGLGAFMAGLLLSDSEYSHEALSGILPFRDIFTSFFFVSIGMLLSVRFLFANPLWIFGMALGVMAMKSVLISVVVGLLGYPLRTAVLTGLAISQVGEFSFVLAKIGVDAKLLEGDNYQLFLAMTVLTMSVTPFVLKAAPAIAIFVGRLPLPQALRPRPKPIETLSKEGKKENHLIILGFGINGRNLAKAAKMAHIPYIILEMNPETIRRYRAAGEPIYFGDATQESTMLHAHIKKARVLVIGISDTIATRKATELARRLNPSLHILVKTRYALEISPLQKLGADSVIAEEFEASIEVFVHVLTKYLAPRNQIDALIAEVRADSYAMLRNLSTNTATVNDLKIQLPEHEITTLTVPSGSAFANRTIQEMNLRKTYGVTVLAIQRNGAMLSNPIASTELFPSDGLIVLGRTEQVLHFAMQLREKT